MYLSLLGYCSRPGAIRLLFLVEIKSLSFAAGLLLMAKGYSTPTPNSDKKGIFRCWAIVDGQGIFDSYF